MKAQIKVTGYVPANETIYQTELLINTDQIEKAIGNAVYIDENAAELDGRTIKEMIKRNIIVTIKIENAE